MTNGACCCLTKTRKQKMEKVVDVFKDYTKAMSATTKNSQKGKELIQAFLNRQLINDLTWSFIRGGKNHDELDVHIWEHAIGSLPPLQVRCLLVDEVDGTYASPRYNLPIEIAPAGETDGAIKERAFQYLKGIYFLVVRVKGLSVTFWLDLFTNYPAGAYTLQARFKGGRKDRIVLKYKNLNLKKFHYIEELIPRLKAAIHENTNK
jgi:hypothetical protein